MRYRALLFVPALMFWNSGCPDLAEEHARPDPAIAVYEPAPAAAIAPVGVPSPPALVAAAVPSAPTAAMGVASAPAAKAPEEPAPAEEPPSAGAELEPDPTVLTTLPPDLVDDGSDDEGNELEAPPEVVEESPPELASVAKETWVFAEPRWKSRRLGYLRAGAIVHRRDKRSGTASCPEGWYHIEPKGYVCVGATASLDVFHPVAEASRRRPQMDGLPYTYVQSRFPPPPLYARLPSAAEAATSEPDLASHLRKVAGHRKDPAFVEPPPEDPLPSALLYGRPLPVFENKWRSPDALLLGHARMRSGYALLSTFDHDGRRFGLTTELELLPLDRTRVVKPSAFEGVALGGEMTLPIAFVMRKHAFRYDPSEGGGLAQGEKLGFRAAIALTGRVKTAGRVRYLEGKDGSFVREDQVVRLDPPKRSPGWASGGRKWIDVSILRQALVAYEGDTPVYATLVSTGRDGLGDPKKTHSTIRGAFLIHTKHVSTTMDGDDAGDEFDLRDVPFVQYFTEGFALHGAYWHDDFGTPRSHGCVNLAPRDAAWLFGWTTPEVPKEWHAALSLKKGTLVFTHP